MRREEWEDTDSDSQEVGKTSEPPFPRHTPRKSAPRSLSPLTKGTRGRQKVWLRDRPHIKRPSNRHLKDATSSVLAFSVTYVFEILRVALVLLRKPLSLILVGYLLAVMMSHLQHAFINTLRSALDPLCILPGISRLALCRSGRYGDLSSPGRWSHDTPRRADYPGLVNIQSASFEHLLDESVGGAGLALEIKKAEMATSDLTTLVRVSSLKSRDRIADTLDAFVDAARHTARGLQRFSAKVGGAVDGIVAVNDYALREIEAASANALSNKYWPSIWIPFFYRPASLAAITNTFTQTMSVLESELHRLILAAEASLHDLDVLEEQLRLLHTIVSREDLSLSISKKELLSSLWTFFGGNRAELQRFETHLELLSGLAEYRQQALAHVVGALHTLQMMSAELETLRERVSEPVMLGDTIPVEVHVKSIRGGLDRLVEGRLKVKRIEEARYAELSAPFEK